MMEAIPTIEKKGYAYLSRAIEHGDDEVNSKRLKFALENVEIDFKQYFELVAKLEEMHQKIQEGLSDRVVINDQKNEKEKEALLYDVVTGLPKQQRRRPHLCAVMVIAIDLDNLREWNKHGHLVGNQALSKVARSIEGAIRKESGDYACRLGTTSDEFIATIRIEKDLDISKLEEIFQKFKRAVNSQHLPVNGVELPVTAAMGYAVVKEGERVNADEIINAADFNQISDKNSEIKAARIKEATQR